MISEAEENLNRIATLLRGILEDRTCLLSGRARERTTLCIDLVKHTIEDVAVMRLEGDGAFTLHMRKHGGQWVFEMRGLQQTADEIAGRVK